MLNRTDNAAFSYTQHTYTATAVSASTVLSSAGYQLPSQFNLDDISANQIVVPEPSTWTILGLGVAALGVVPLRCRRAARAKAAALIPSFRCLTNAPATTIRARFMPPSRGMALPPQHRRFTRAARRDEAPDVVNVVDPATNGIDEAILAAGFRPIPFPHFLESFAKYLPAFLHPSQRAAPPIPEPLTIHPPSAVPPGEQGAANAGQHVDTASSLGPATSLPAVAATKRAIKSPAIQLEPAQPHSVLRGEVTTRPCSPCRSLVFTALGCLLTGVLVDHCLLQPADHQAPRSAASDLAASASARTVASRLQSVEEESLDAAYQAQKEGRYLEAKQRFCALTSAHPQWRSIQAAVGTAAMYQRDLPAAQVTFEALTSQAPASADANFRLGVLFTVQRAYERAEGCFAAAAATDPSRPEYYYFWGECLHQEGKALEAAARFRSALLRNEFDAADSFYRLKLWLCEIETDMAERDGTGAQIDAALAGPSPPVEALVAAAARGIKAGDYKAAARFLLQVRPLVAPSLYFVILQDPIFRQEQWRPEMAPVFAGHS